MNSTSSIRRRIAGASILVAAVAGCAGTPSAFAGTSPSLKAVAPPGVVDSATIKRLNELEQAAVLRCLGTVEAGVDQAACTPQKPGSPVGPVGGGPKTGAGFAHQGGGVIDMDALGCKGGQGPVRPGEAAMDSDLERYSTARLRQWSRDASAAAANARAEAERIDKLAKEQETIARADGDELLLTTAKNNHALVGFLDQDAREWEMLAAEVDAELARREQTNSSPNARRPVPRPGSSLPKPDDVAGGPSALACATMEKSRSKTPEELKQANTPMVQYVCADPAKQDGEQQPGLQVDCAPDKPMTNECAIEGTPTCVERTSPLAGVRKIPGLVMNVPGVVTGCAGRKDVDCG